MSDNAHFIESYNQKYAAIFARKIVDIKKIGKSSGADLIVFGNINMNPKTFMGKTTKDYSVNIRITDIESGEEVARTRYKLSKYSKRNKIGW